MQTYEMYRLAFADAPSVSLKSPSSKMQGTHFWPTSPLKKSISGDVRTAARSLLPAASAWKRATAIARIDISGVFPNLASPMHRRVFTVRVGSIRRTYGETIYAPPFRSAHTKN